MVAEFGMPPEAKATRSMVEQRLNHAKAEDGAKVTVEFRGEQRHLHVISMPVDMLYYNPDTHRIRAQLTLDPARHRLLQDAPWSEESQLYLDKLLQCKPSNPSQTDPEFTELMEQLESFGQQEPGIISPYGVLVDGNTRCAALRKLGVKDIRVGVLPPDTSPRDINAVELALQLRRDKRREYSYINRLVAIEDELASGRREEDVVRDFHTNLKTLQADRWVYTLIREAIERSAGPGGAQLKLVDFEDHQEKLRELRRDYHKLAATDSSAAEQLKETRLAMIVLNFSKTDLRLAEADFYSRYLDDRLPGDLKPRAQDTADVAIPGLPGVSVPDATPGVKRSRELTDTLLKARASVQAGDALGPETVAVSSRLLKSALDTFDTSVKLAGQNARYQKRRSAVPERLTDAADYVHQCASEFAEARAKRALDEEAFDDALLTLRESLSRLAKQAGRTFDAPRDGVAWLLEATREHE